MAIMVIKVVACLIGMTLAGSVKTDKPCDQTVVDYRTNPEVLNAILGTH